MLFATHYLEEADQYADRIILIGTGGSSPTAPASEIKALAAGRTVRATLPGADHGAGPRSAAWTPSRSAATPSVHAKDSDAVARYLLTETAARDLEIIARGLEDAFLSLTGRRQRRPTREEERR